MIIRYPWLLLLLLAVPLVAWVRLRLQLRPRILFSDGEILARLPRSWAVRLQFLPPLLFALGLAALVVALARPQKGIAETEIHTEAVDIVLLQDVSTSMQALDFSTAAREMNRLDASKRVIERFIENRPDDRIGIVVFAAMPYTLAPLTLDHEWLIRRLADTRPGMVEDGTAIGDGLVSAVNRLRKSQSKSKLIVLLTDGLNNRGAVPPITAAQAAQAMNIKVYTVGAGTTGDAPIPVPDIFGNRQIVYQRVEMDENLLKEISRLTGGAYFRATNFKALQEIYAQIDKMEKTEVRVEHYSRYEERFALWAWFALACLALEKLLGLTRLGRLPA